MGGGLISSPGFEIIRISYHITLLSYVCILNIFITFSTVCSSYRCPSRLAAASLRLVKVRSYGRYDVNGFLFCSTAFEALHPLAATTNSGVPCIIVLSVLSMSKVECMVGSTQGEPL
jgi:hypothetical protein